MVITLSHYLSKKIKFLVKNLMSRFSLHNIYAQKLFYKKYLKYSIYISFNKIFYLKRFYDDIKNVNISLLFRYLKKSFFKPTLLSNNSTKETCKLKKKYINIYDSITVLSLAQKMNIKVIFLINQFLKMGFTVSKYQKIDFDSASVLSTKLGFPTRNMAFKEDVIIKKYNNINAKQIKTRPPIVTIMGHVNHGKTTLINLLCKEKDIIKEAGNITQHIRIYNLIHKKKITIIDTPGHKFFSSIRSRGVKITDIVVLVIAANDGIMQQTEESIHYAQKFNVPIIVAINKIDLCVNKISEITRNLAKYNLIPKIWGGDTLIFKISAKKQIGINELLDGIEHQAKILDLKTNHNGFAKGIVLDSQISRVDGSISTLLVQKGTLSIGNIIIAGSCIGKIKFMINMEREKISHALPSMGVKIASFSKIPEIGSTFYVVKTEKEAKTIIAHRLQKIKQEKSIYNKNQSFIIKSNQNIKKLTFILKADTFSSIDAILNGIKSLKDYKNLDIIQTGVGNVNENDVRFASIFKGIVLSFNCLVDVNTHKIALQSNVEIKKFDVIYDIFHYLNDTIKVLDLSVCKEEYLGKALVKKTFISETNQYILGCYVLDGKFLKNGIIKITRNDQTIQKCNIVNLRRFKVNVDEVYAGLECGIILSSSSTVEINDILKCYNKL